MVTSSGRITRSASIYNWTGHWISIHPQLRFFSPYLEKFLIAEGTHADRKLSLIELYLIRWLLMQIISCTRGKTRMTGGRGSGILVSSCMIQRSGAYQEPQYSNGYLEIAREAYFPPFRASSFGKRLPRSYLLSPLICCPGNDMLDMLSTNCISFTFPFLVLFIYQVAGPFKIIE